MLKEEIFIEKPITDVWEFVITEYAKTFKCSPSQLEGKEVEATANSFSGKPVKIKQTVQIIEVNKRIEVLFLQLMRRVKVRVRCLERGTISYFHGQS